MPRKELKPTSFDHYWRCFHLLGNKDLRIMRYSVRYNQMLGEAVSFLTFPHTSTVSSRGTSDRAGAKHFCYNPHLVIQVKMEMMIFLIIFILNNCNSQYNIIRINPLKKLSESLTTHHEEQHEGEYMSLQCPPGTKVVICLFNILAFMSFLFSDIHYLCSLWKQARW